MNEDSSQHQLNGYKYSFSRVNPYHSKLNSQSIHIDPNLSSSQQIIPNQPQSQSKLKTNSLQDDSLQDNTNTNKSLLIKSTKLKPLHIKQVKQPTPINHNITNNTKLILYNKFQQNQKNKVLIDLYLKTNKLYKIKPNPNKNQLSKLKNKLNSIKLNHDNDDKNNINITCEDKKYLYNDSNLISDTQQFTLSLIPHTKLTSKQSTQQKHPKSHRYQSTPLSINEHKDKHNQILIIESSHLNSKNQPNDNNVKIKQRTITEPNKSKTNRNNIKLVRNLSQHKFLAYLTSSKQQFSRGKHSTSGTTPVNQLTKLTLSSQPFYQSNQQKVKQIHHQHKKHVSLKINTQGSLEQYALDSSLMKFSSQNDQNKTVRKNLGALKYKSPRIIVSSRNKKFLSKRQVGPKIRLFTEEQEDSIIKQFYSEQKNQ